MRSLLLLILLGFTSHASAHGGSPSAVRLEFFASHPGTTWILTTNQGLYADLKDGFRWLCEDAVVPSSGLRGLIVRGERGSQWTVATSEGLFESEDMGCGFRRIGSFGDQPLVGLWTTEDNTWLTGTTVVDQPNTIYWSRDQGEEWRRSAGQIDGRPTNILISKADPNLVLVQSSGGLYRSLDRGLTFQDLPVEVNGQDIPGEFIISAALSPVLSSDLLLAVSARTRTRVLKSQDAGQTWTDVFLVPEPAVEVVYDRSGTQVLAYSLTGLAWRSADGGDTWSGSSRLPATLGCLRYGPLGRLWACADPYRGGPWVTAYSVDFGHSWTPVMDAFEHATERWDCGPNDRGTQCCLGLCPGDQDPVACGQPRVETLPMECVQPDVEPENVLDMGLQDSGSIGRPDMGRANDGDIRTNDAETTVDSSQYRSSHSRNNGCTSLGSESVTVPFIYLLMAVFLRRRTHGA